MAAAVVGQGVTRGASGSFSPAKGALSGDHCVLVVVGALQSHGALELILRQIETDCCMLCCFEERESCCVTSGLSQRR
uniref:Uncharacterized protein n=1 Tax=Knipowitschia caucasica TaxID=637954 RepID=A0AAV2M1U9_KNICA